MMFELSKQFRFEAAHTLNRDINAESSRRVHGHSYRAEIVIRGKPDASTGMVIDLGLVERALLAAHEALDHRLLDEIPGLSPATLENISLWIWRLLSPTCVGLNRVTIYRDSLAESCTYFGPQVGS